MRRGRFYCRKWGITAGFRHGIAGIPNRLAGISLFYDRGHEKLQVLNK
jgi:hypothetical protein